MKGFISTSIFVVLIAALLPGCSSTPKPPPLPDGHHRVPVNATQTGGQS